MRKEEPYCERSVCRFGVNPVAKKSLRIKQARTPRFAVRKYSRCLLCGRSRAYYRRFRMCRLCLRSFALKGQIPGLTKASW